MKKRVRVMVVILLSMVAAYVTLVALVWWQQEALLFPARLASAFEPATYPTNLQPIKLTTPDGVELVGHINKNHKSGQPLVLTFGGNVHNATLLASYLAGLLPDVQTVVFYYRGYGQSQGRPAAKSFLADSLFIYDQLQQQLKPSKTLVMGASLGTGMATWVASQRGVSGLVLVMPYDSFSLVAKEAAPLLPIRYFIRHQIPTKDWMPNVSAPVAIIAAEQDDVVQPQRTAALRQQVPNLVANEVLAGANHLSLLTDPRLDTWLKSTIPSLLNMKKPG